MITKKLVGVVLSLFLLIEVANARNNAALFGVAAATIAGAAIIANSRSRAQEPRYNNAPPRRHYKKKRRRAVVITPEMKIQKSLVALGFYQGKIDGKLNGYATRTAIKNLNTQYRTGDGTSIGQRTWDQLLYLAELYQMDNDLFTEGNQKRVKGKRIQTALKIHGTYHGKIDGITGNGTRKAIALYKGQEGLSLTTSLTSNERYNLITSAQSINTRAIDEAIGDLNPASRSAQPAGDVQTQSAPPPQSSTQATGTQEIADPEMTEPAAVQ